MGELTQSRKDDLAWRKPKWKRVAAIELRGISIPRPNARRLDVRCREAWIAAAVDLVAAE